MTPTPQPAADMIALLRDKNFTMSGGSQFALEIVAALASSPQAQAQPDALDAILGRVAMRFVDRAGDVHPGIDDAETICAEFHAAMSAALQAARSAPAQPVQIASDEITVNLMRLAGLDKHKARECEAIVRQILARSAARHSADTDRPVSDEKESDDTSLLREAADALSRIARVTYGLEMSCTDEERANHWSKLALGYRQIAAALLAKLRERLKEAP
jgi:hypothetical protein